MGMMPFNVLGIWFRGLLAIAILAGGLFLLREWYREAYAPREVVVVEPQRERDDVAAGRGRRVVREPAPAWHFGWNRATAYLVGGLALTALALGGGSLGAPLLRRAGHDDPRAARNGQFHRISRPDGTELHVEIYGPADGIPVVLTHGWGLDSTEWYYAKKALSDRFRLIVWDLPGLGRSTRPRNNDFSLEKLASDLEAVLSLAGDRPAILLGHSIGGMITLTFCRLFSGALGRRVAGLVLTHTTYTNPVKTTKHAALYTALQKPVLEPLLHLTIWLSPVVWLMTLMSYLNGSLHRSTDRASFAGHETRGQLNFATRFQIKASPAVTARGMLGMLRYDATGVLGTIPVPTLVIAGDRDTTTLPEASVMMRESIPRATMVTLAPARHLGLIEWHEQFTTEVRTFVDSLATAEAVA